MKAIIVTCLALLALPLQAEVYKSVTPDGEVIYSDVPSKGAKPLNVPRPQTYTPVLPPVAAQAAASEQAADDTEDTPYKSLVIDSPVHEETVRDNQGNIEMLVTATPGLLRKDGHRIVYLLDGERHGRPTVDTRKVFTNVDRGEHQLAVAIVDASDNVIIEADPVTVFLHRASIQHPFNPRNPNNPNKKPPPAS